MRRISKRLSGRAALKKAWKAAQTAIELEAALGFDVYYSKAFADRGWTFGSVSSSPGSRSDVLLDWAILAQSARKLADGGRFALSEKPGRAVSRRGLYQLQRLKRRGYLHGLTRKAKHKITSHGGIITLHVPAWDHTSEVMKGFAYMASMTGWRRLAFTLHLSPAIVRKSLASPKGASRYLQDRIATHLRQAFPGCDPIRFVMALEHIYDLQGALEVIPLHVHGVIELPDIPAPAKRNASIPDLIGASLRKAGGAYAAPSRQVKFRWVGNPVKWASYIFKNRLATTYSLKAARKAAGLPTVRDGTVGASENLRTTARQWYEQAKRTEEPHVVARTK